jgi:hypothetical protein
MGGDGRDRRLAQADEDYDYGDVIMDDVQYGRGGTRMILPLRYPSGPEFDPKDVPVFQGPHHKQYDPRYGASEERLLAGGPNQDAMLDAIRRLLGGYV